jgi:hypothetical protein
MPGDSTNKQASKARPSFNVVADPRRDSAIFTAAAEPREVLGGTRIAGSSLDGIVDAAVVPIDRDYYAFELPMLISGRLSAHPSATLLRQKARLRAADLVAELREISGQVSRMMSQVERAIDHLAIHAW